MLLAPRRPTSPSRGRHRGRRRRPLLHAAGACVVVAAVAAGVAGADTDDAGAALAASSSRATVPPLVPLDVKPSLEDPKVLAASRRRATSARDHRARLVRKARAARAAERRRLAAMDPRDLARALLGEHGWSSGQFRCLDALWTRESGWDRTATNRSSGAYGIPQALPGSKMASVGSDWRTNPLTQIRWGLRYIRASYGSPCSAWGHSQAYGWY